MLLEAPPAPPTPVCCNLLWQLLQTKAAGRTDANWFSKNTGGKHFVFFFFGRMQQMMLALYQMPSEGPFLQLSPLSPFQGAWNSTCSPSSEDSPLASPLPVLPETPGALPPYLPMLPLTNDWFKGWKPTFLAWLETTLGHKLHSQAHRWDQAGASFCGIVPDVALEWANRATSFSADSPVSLESPQS